MTYLKKPIALVSMACLTWLAVGLVSQAQTHGDVDFESLQKWDCLVNDTGVTIHLVVTTGRGTAVGTVPNGESFPFKVSRKTHKAVFVAHEEGTDKLIKMQEFSVLHQDYPPNNCLPITKAEREKMKSSAL